jgi:hypothetical protein
LESTGISGLTIGRELARLGISRGGSLGGVSAMLIGYGDGMWRVSFIDVGIAVPFLWLDGGWDEIPFVGEGAIVMCWRSFPERTSFIRSLSISSWASSKKSSITMEFRSLSDWMGRSWGRGLIGMMSDPGERLSSPFTDIRFRARFRKWLKKPFLELDEEGSSSGEPVGLETFGGITLDVDDNWRPIFPVGDPRDNVFEDNNAFCFSSRSRAWACARKVLTTGCRTGDFSRLGDSRPVPSFTIFRENVDSKTSPSNGLEGRIVGNANGRDISGLEDWPGTCICDAQEIFGGSTGRGGGSTGLGGGGAGGWGTGMTMWSSRGYEDVRSCVGRCFGGENAMPPLPGVKILGTVDGMLGGGPRLSWGSWGACAGGCESRFLSFLNHPPFYSLIRLKDKGPVGVEAEIGGGLILVGKTASG